MITRLGARSFAECQERFASDGYLLFPGIVPREPLAVLRTRILDAFESARREGSLFTGGGLVNGHLNCFPGEESRFVYDALEQGGVLELTRSLAPAPLANPNIGCNLNLPGSKAQNYHVDGYAATEFLIVNVAGVDTDLVNGAMDVLEGTHRRAYKYWQLVVAAPRARRLPMGQGDVLVRTSVLWHRGMPNRSSAPRPMLAFTWENGGNVNDDPYRVHGGKITFLPNRYGTDWRGRATEHAFTAAPRLGAAYRFARSLLRE